MTKVSIREFRANMSTWLKQLPLELTSFDKVVACVYTPQDDKDKELNLLKEYVKELEKQLNNKKDSVYTPLGITPKTATEAELLKRKPQWEEIEARKCEWPFCKATAEREADYWEWHEGELKSKKVPLCKRHIENSLRRKEERG
jgi:hypothetical protein